MNLFTYYKNMKNLIRNQLRNELLLKESEEKYRLLFELSPDAIIVYSKGLIIFANCKASSKLGMENPSELIGREVLDFIHPDSMEAVKVRMYKTQVKNEAVPPMLHKIIKPNGEVLEAEVCGSPITYDGKQMVQLFLRDVTEEKKAINRAVQIQKHRQRSAFPLKDKVQLETIYKPAEILSGDFYDFHKVNEDIIFGLIGDVTGKGITAALNISAMKVIFHGAALYANSPLQLIQYMNKEVETHLGEDYVSCCCFEMNFKTGVLRAAGAGINEFIKFTKEGTYNKIAAEGLPLGMFDDSNSEQISITFSKGDTFNFFSDGLCFIFNYEELYKDVSTLVPDNIKNYLDYKISTIQNLKDDLTWLSLKIL